MVRADPGATPTRRNRAAVCYARCVIPSLRSAFNAAFTPAKHEAFLRGLTARCGPVPFRLSESPLFLPREAHQKLYRIAGELITLAAAAAPTLPEDVVPPSWRVPRRDDAPCFALVDLAIVRDPDGSIGGRLVELQGFPSLAAFTLLQLDALREQLAAIPGVGPGFTSLAPGLSREEALRITREALLGDEPPEATILLEIEPHKQKTICDFEAHRQLLGLDAVCVTELQREGRRLFRVKDGRRIEVRRIYNRVVFDELDRKQPKMAFSFADELDVTWVPHPDWQWLWSKLTLPRLSHPSVPEAHFLSELREVPADLSDWVLKPLFSFAGAGVKLGPSRADLDAVPEAERRSWLLQRRITYAREMVTPRGEGIAAEVRFLCLRPKGAKLPVPIGNLVRLSRGQMLGVDQNRDMDWVGASLALFPEG